MQPFDGLFSMSFLNFTDPESEPVLIWNKVGKLKYRMIGNPEQEFAEEISKRASVLQKKYNEEIRP